MVKRPKNPVLSVASIVNGSLEGGFACSLSYPRFPSHTLHCAGSVSVLGTNQQCGVPLSL